MLRVTTVSTSLYFEGIWGRSNIVKCDDGSFDCYTKFRILYKTRSFRWSFYNRIILRHMFLLDFTINVIVFLFLLHKYKGIFLLIYLLYKYVVNLHWHTLILPFVCRFWCLLTIPDSYSVEKTKVNTKVKKYLCYLLYL